MSSNSNIWLAVQDMPFDQNEVYQWLNQDDNVGASVIFVGKVRNFNCGNEVANLELEHYSAMTIKSLQEIIHQSQERFKLQRVAVIHRVGKMSVNDEIVVVGTSSMHRHDAYQANQFIMDYLKTQAPFWKKEQTSTGERWVESRDSDYLAQKAWENKF